MSTPDLLEPPASEREAEMAKVAQRCLMAALDHSRAQRIALVDEKGEIADAPVLELPPQALRDVHPLGARNRVLLEGADGAAITVETALPVQADTTYSVMPDPQSVRAFARG